MYQPRTYRHWVKGDDLVDFRVAVKETDLYLRAASDLHRKAHRLVLKHREGIEKYIARHPDFLTSLEPLDVEADAPKIVRAMADAARLCGVGSMAAVAGAIAEYVGKELLEFSPEIIVENGGDIYLKSRCRRTIGVFAGGSPLTGKLGLQIEPQDTPLGICTSSGTVGHSLSFGKADAVIVLAGSATLADAAATAIGNRVSDVNDIEKGIELAQGIGQLQGVVIIKDDRLGVWGDIKLVATGSE
ncbi:MAG: thiamine biosynthesis protein ApbE [Dehalococcoidia bacterium SG8_51_3]|nr:MAG: thiamine biosynthesis protein ApbE [Dehalococcoidia bacterium SG8_51_3]